MPSSPHPSATFIVLYSPVFNSAWTPTDEQKQQLQTTKPDSDNQIMAGEIVQNDILRK